jgi:hypothetical protein
VRRGLLIGLAACSAAPHPTSPPPQVVSNDAAGIDAAPPHAVDCGGTPATTAPLVVRVDHDGCFGRCSTYSIAVYGDGTIDYVGRAYVAELGRRVLHVDAARAAELAHRFAAIGFSTLPDFDQPGFTDGPTGSVRVGTALVHISEGDPRIPPALTELEDAIDALVGLAPGRAYGDRACKMQETLYDGRIVAANVDGATVRLVVSVGEAQGITPAWHAQLLGPGTNQLLATGKVTIVEVRPHMAIVTLAASDVPKSTNVRFWR